MTWYHKPKAIAQAARDVVLARAVAKRLRSCGIACKLHDIRDTHGARLIPANLRVAGCFVLVRSVGYQPAPHSRDALYLAENPRAYLQRGAADVTGLIQHVAPRHWNAPLVDN
jgi:hypothetical protein